MSNEKTRNDFIFFQNEILGDVKKIETKLFEKINQTTSFIETQTQKYDQKIKDVTERLTLLSKQMEEQNNSTKLQEAIEHSRHKLEDLVTKLEVKLNILEKDFNNACFKYDKIFSNNLLVPGLIGTACPYDNLKSFLEYTNQKLAELTKAKDKQNLDTKKYKEKLESIITQNKIQFETAQNKITDYCSQRLEQGDVICKDRMNLIEKRVEALRIENGQYAYELKQKTEEIKIDWEKLNKIENTLTKKYKEEWNKFSDKVDMLTNKIDLYKDEFYVIKDRFTDLSEFIKDVRFRRNLNNMGNMNIMNNMNNKNNMSPNVSEGTVEGFERRKYKKMSTRIDFSKKRRTKRKTQSDYYIQNENNDNENLGPDAHYNNNQYIKEQNSNNKNENNISYNNNNININESPVNNKEIKINNKGNEMKLNLNEDNKEEQNIHEIKNQMKTIKKYSKFNVDNNFYNKEKTINRSRSYKKINEIFPNNNTEFQIANSHGIKTDKRQDIKFKNIKSKNNNKNNEDNYNYNNTYHIINYNNDNNTYNIINYNNNFNKSNSIYTNDISKNIDNKEQNKINYLLYSENAKINDLILGADFSGNNISRLNGPKYNLSQAYIILKRRSEEYQKMKKGGKSETKYNSITPTLPMSRSRNFNNYKNVYFPKKNNKEDLYYSSLKKDKLKNLGINQNINLNLTNQDNPDKNNFPKIFKEMKQTKLNNNDKNNLFYSSMNEGSKKNLNNSNHTIVDYSSVNINENSFDEKISKKNIKSHKKLLCSISDRNLLMKLSPITPIYKNSSISNNDEKNKSLGNAKDTLNHIKPYLIKKFKDK